MLSPLNDSEWFCKHFKYSYFGQLIGFIELSISFEILLQVEMLKDLNHKYIVRYLESFSEANTKSLCIVMEFCDHGTLTQVLKVKERIYDSLTGSKIY